jgi:hypothetical protein
MHKVFIIQETEQMRRVLDGSYAELLAAAREGNKKAVALRA